jgi:hypothetical protein
VKRDCELIVLSKDGKRAIFIDTENKEEILAYLSNSDKHKKKFAYISKHLLEGIRNTDIYDKENINDKCKDVTAMKFFKGGSNDRIYCKEVSSDEGVFVVITSILHKKKKSQKNSNREITKIETVASYEYTPMIPPKEEESKSKDKSNAEKVRK